MSDRITQPVALVFEQQSVGSSPTLKLRVQSLSTNEEAYARVAFPNSSQDNPVIFLRDKASDVQEPVLDFIDVHNLSTQNATDANSVKLSMTNIEDLEFFKATTLACRQTVCMMLFETKHNGSPANIVYVQVNLNANLVGISSIGT